MIDIGNKNFECHCPLKNKEPGQEAIASMKGEMSDGPIDRSDPSDKCAYGRTKILPMAKYSIKDWVVVYPIELREPLTFDKIEYNRNSENSKHFDNCLFDVSTKF